MIVFVARTSVPMETVPPPRPGPEPSLSAYKLTVPSAPTADAAFRVTFLLARRVMEPPPSVVTAPTLISCPAVMFSCVLVAVAVIADVTMMSRMAVTLIWLSAALAVIAPVIDTSFPATKISFAPATLAVIAPEMEMSLPAIRINCAPAVLAVMAALMLILRPASRVKFCEVDQVTASFTLMSLVTRIVLSLLARLTATWPGVSSPPVVAMVQSTGSSNHMPVLP